MKARYKVGDLIGLPVRLGPDRGKKKTALVIEVWEWESRAGSWSYLVLTSDGQDIRFEQQGWLCQESELLVAA